MTKDELRREMRARLRALGPERGQKSRAIVEAVAAHPAFVQCERVALFAPLPSEPAIEGLWEKGAHTFCYPCVVGEQLEFIEIPSLGHLAPSAWNRQIHEPAFAQAHLVTPAEIKLMIVPGLAFTRDGHRLGRGGGFYDRYLALLPSTAVKIGVCFSVQIVPSLPAEPHDQHMNAIITEQGPLDALG